MLHSSHLWTGPTKKSVQQSKKTDDNDTISPVRLSLGLIYDKLATKRKHFQTKNYNDLVQSLSKPKFELPNKPSFKTLSYNKDTRRPIRLVWTLHTII